MSGKDDTSSNKAVWIGTLCALIIAVVVGVTVWLNKKSESAPATGLQKPETIIARKGPETVRQPMPKPTAENTVAPERKSPPVVDYDKLKEDESLRALMEKRKEKYGFEKGVDLIVKPDESVKVGDTVVPMNEILDRIRLKEGEVVEKDIGGSHAAETPEDKKKKMVAELDSVEKHYEHLDQLIQEKKPTRNKTTTETYTQEREELGKIVTVYEDYKETVKKIEEKKQLLASLNEKESSLKSPEPAETPAQAASSPSAGGAVQRPESADGSAAAAPRPTAPTASTVPAPVQGSAKPETSRAAVDAGTNHPPVATPQGKQAAADSGQHTAAPKPSGTQKPVASTGTPELSALSPGGMASPEVAAREGKRMLTIESLKKQIEEEINTLMLQKGDLENELLMLLKKEKRPEAYGIYVVQRNDNIWNIHYKFLKEYFNHRHIDLSRNADEPDSRGRSSGVGKVLKFSEKMVYIYNVRERRLASDINLIHPLSKIVVFNMAKVFNLLEGVNYSDMDQIRFDGENIWLPAKS